VLSVLSMLHAGLCCEVEPPTDDLIVIACRVAGRMYVFEHFVCFHSNVFGYVKDKAIPLKVLSAPCCWA
jgi:GRAM domain